MHEHPVSWIFPDWNETEEHDGDWHELQSQFQRDGFAQTMSSSLSHRVLSEEACLAVKERLPLLFRGEFETGIYPDEWHWRQGISLPYVTREICNAWKSDRTIASVVLSERLAKFVATFMQWDSIRLAQDDVIWKPPVDHRLHASPLIYNNKDWWAFIRMPRTFRHNLLLVTTTQ